MLVNVAHRVRCAFGFNWIPAWVNNSFSGHGATSRSCHKNNTHLPKMTHFSRTHSRYKVSPSRYLEGKRHSITLCDLPLAARSRRQQTCRDWKVYICYRFVHRNNITSWRCCCYLATFEKYKGEPGETARLLDVLKKILIPSKKLSLSISEASQKFQFLTH